MGNVLQSIKAQFREESPLERDERWLKKIKNDEAKGIFEFWKWEYNRADWKYDDTSLQQERDVVEERSLRESILEILYRRLRKVQPWREALVLDLTNVPLGNRGLVALTRYLRRGVAIERLSLRNCGLCIDEGPNSPTINTTWDKDTIRSSEHVWVAQLIAMSFRRCAMAHLDLSFNAIGPLGMIEITKGFEEQGTLTLVDFSHTGIGDEGVESLVSHLLHNTTLRRLFLKNVGMGDRGAQSLASLLDTESSTSAVEYIDLSDNEITDNGGQVLHEAAKKSPSIESIILNGNPFCEPFIRKLNEQLMRVNSPTLEYLAELLTQGPAKLKVSTNRLSVASYARKGGRPTMEDVITVLREFGGKEGDEYFGVFDGHETADVARYAAENLHLIIEEKLHALEPAAALREAYLEINAQIFEKRIKGGTTALTCLIKDGKMFIANVGDSRGVLRRAGKVLRVSVDHNTDNPLECERVIATGGVIKGGRIVPREDLESNVHTSGGYSDGLTVTRALGDEDFTPYLSADPFIVSRDIEPDDEFLVLASDGVWQEIDDELAADVVGAEADPRAACLQLASQAFWSSYRRELSSDNISMIVVRFNRG